VKGIISPVLEAGTIPGRLGIVSEHTIIVVAVLDDTWAVITCIRNSHLEGASDGKREEVRNNFTKFEQ
jgi:hypothetical protein